MTTQAVPLRLAIMRDWIGQKEVPGAAANPVIAGTPTSWFSLVDYPEIRSDEVANCAAAIGAALVLETFAQLGYTLADLDAEDDESAVAAWDALELAKATTPLPVRERRLLARGYADYGIDAESAPRPGDIIVIPRGAAWQGHVMMIDEVQSGLRRYRCIGSNQSDETSYAYVRFDAAIVAIRRPIAPTAKELAAAGSNGVRRGQAIKTVGDAVSVGAGGTAVVMSATDAAAPAADVVAQVPVPDVTTLDGMKTATESIGIVDAFVAALVGFGKVFVSHPWLVGLLCVGIVLRIYGLQAIAARVRSFIAGVPLALSKEVPRA